MDMIENFQSLSESVCFHIVISVKFLKFLVKIFRDFFVPIKYIKKTILIDAIVFQP